MTKVGFIFLALLIVTLARANNELKLKAISEVESPRVLKKSANDVSIHSDGQSILTLSDPTPKMRTRSYDWLLGVKVQSFQPSGQLQSDSTTTLSLENIPSFYLPTLEMGLRFQSSHPQWHWGPLVHAGFSSQASLVSFKDQTQDPEARLTTLLSDGGLMLDFEPQPDSWGVFSSAGVGVINYSQSGSSSFSKITEDATFQFFSAGLHFHMNTKWQVLISHMNRNLINPEASKVFMPSDSTELGTRFLW